MTSMTQTLEPPLTTRAAVVPAPRQTTGRYLFVDALRGVAAASVVLFHVFHRTTTAMGPAFRGAVPQLLLRAFDVGDRGVEVFFVISGFVIAHSIGRVRPDLPGAANFILRRQVRLDLPYWTVIALAVVDAAVAARRSVAGPPPVPTAGAVLLNLFYLQHVVPHGTHLLGVAWTLCLEIQFYLLFMAAMMVGYRLSGRRANPGPVTVWVVIASAIGCLWFARRQFAVAMWFPSFWPYFALGAVCYWATHGHLSRWAASGYAAAFAAAAVVAATPPAPGDRAMGSYMLVALLTAASLYAAAVLGRLRTWGRNAVVQHFGRLSYSLYLVHLLVATAVARVAVAVPHHGRGATLGWLALTLAATVAAAELLHRAVEVPSMRWAARLKRPWAETA